MPASWSRSHTLGIKQKAFSWRIDGCGNIFIKRKFRRGRFPRIDKVSCSYLEKLCRFMEDLEWKDLANNAAKLYMGTEKEGIGKFMYRLRPEVPYAQLSSQLAAIFYHAKVWKWNERKRGIKFLMISGEWQEKTMQHYTNSLLSSENENISMDRFLKYKKIKIEGQEKLDKMPAKGEQTKLSVFFDY
jgi:hypothetical protein